MTSIVFAGTGGQGVITISYIIGKAAVHEGKNVLMTELHGMAQRGGKIAVELRIGDYRSSIIPMGTADALVAFEEMEAMRNSGKLREGGIVLVNRRKIHPVTLITRAEDYPDELVQDFLGKIKATMIDADEIALGLGNKRTVNVVMLGALFSTGILGLGKESILSAIRESLGEKNFEVNSRAFEAGQREMEIARAA